MTECVYSRPITSFAVDIQPQEVFEVDILGKGRAALEKANDELGKRRFWSLNHVYNKKRLYNDIYLEVTVVLPSERKINHPTVGL